MLVLYKKLIHTSLLILILLLTACSGSKATKVNNEVAVDSVVISVTEPFQKNAKMGNCSVKFTIEYLTKAHSKEVLTKINQLILTKVIGMEYDSLSLKEAAQSFSKSFIKTYREDLKQLRRDSLLPEEGLNYSYEQTCRLTQQKEGILTFRSTVYQYLGGAHPNQTAQLFNIMADTGKLITLSDVFDNGYEEELDKLLTNQLMADNQVKSKEELMELGYFVNTDIFPSASFCVKNDKMIFLYNPYDIAPYALGSIEVALKLSEIRDLMREDAPF
ncbi:MAG: DUF3298 domain-containing protein [Bacteroidaceae bacterium]